MALARVQYESDGSTTEYSIPYPYISRDDIYVSVDGTETEDWSFLDGSTVKLDSAAPQGDIIDIVRKTEREDLLVEFNDGSTLLESDLTLAAQQSFYIAQEAFDQTGSTLAVAEDGSYSANDRRISLLGYPTQSDDASTKSYVDDIFAQGEDAYDMATEAGNWANYSVDSLVPEGDGVDDYSALHHATKASEDASSASSSASAASTSETNAAASESAAATSETNAAASESAAATSEANAATSETNAKDSENAAATSEANAQDSENAAASSAASASTSETNAADSENQAQLWAEESEDVTVEPGSYSAMHHAIKASNSASSAANSESAAATSESNAATSEQNAATSETNADAYQTEAGNWANLAEDQLVPEGDGVDDYSALHWSRKAEQYAASIDPATLVKKDNDTGAAYLPSGTTAERPGTPSAGYMRFNTDVGLYEGYTGTEWVAVGSGAKGGGGDQVFVENDQTVTTDYTIPADKNAMSTGPVSIDDGVTVTVSDGARWAVI